MAGAGAGRRAPGGGGAAPLRRRGGAARDRAWTPEAFWAGAGAIIHDLAPRNRELLARRDELQSPHRRAGTASTPGAPDAGGLRRVPPRDRLPARRARRRRGDHRRRRRRGGPHRRPAARRTAAQRALRHQRRQRPLGLALRRALRHRRGPARGRARPGRGLQQGPRRRGHPRAAAPSSTSTSRSPPARTPTPRRTPWTTRAWP